MDLGISPSIEVGLDAALGATGFEALSSEKTIA